MAKNEVKWGAILSYILIIANALYGLFLTPYILGKLGETEYGVYKTIASFTSSLMVLDLGFGGTLMRYIAKFRVDKEESKIANFVAMGLIQAAIICGFILLVITGLYFSLDKIFSKGLTLEQIGKAKELYVFLGMGIIAHIFNNVLNGTVCGYNRFTIANGLKIFQLIFRILLIIVLLYFFQNSLVLVLVDLALTILLIIIQFVYIRFNLKLKIRLNSWDNSLFKSSLKYTILLFITSIAAQINGNLDNVVIGALRGAAAVTIYSMGLLIFGMFEQLSTAISSVMLPTVTKTLKTDDEKYSKTQELVIRAGRVQFMLLGAALVGFIVVGQDFVKLWLGNGFEDIYTIVLILMIPSLLELCVNVCLSILRAENNLSFRTYVLLATTILNAIITVVGTYFWGYFAAAIGTAISFLLGSVVIMNVYYNKKYKFNMFNIYRKIFGNIWICLVLSGGACYLGTLIFDGLIFRILMGVILFFITYVITLCLFGFNKDEKKYIKIFKQKGERNNG